MMYKGWIIYNEQDAERNRAYIDWFLEEAQELGTPLQLIMKENLSFGVRKGKLYIESVQSGLLLDLPDYCVMRNMDELLTIQLEALGVKVFNNSFLSRIANDKARTCQYLAMHGIPMPDTDFVNAWDYREERYATRAYPVVVKAVSGRSGSEVYLVNSPEELTACVLSRATGTNADSALTTTAALVTDSQPGREGRYIIQELVQPGKDVRVFVVGNQIVGAVLRESEHDFRANHSLGGGSSLYSLNEAEMLLVDRIIEKFDIGLVGIDFVFGTDGTMLFNEVEDVVGSRTLSLHSDINIVRIYLNHILEQLVIEKEND